MASNFKAIVRKGIGSSVGKNALSLYSIQFANYILPLITVPYLVRVLGVQRFGTVAFGQGLIAYFTAIVSYGFDWSATRRISVVREDADTVNRLAANTWSAKGLLCVVSFCLLMLLIELVPRVRQVHALLILLFGGVVGSALLPTWLFQGLERMVPISAISLSARSLVVIAMFLFVRKPDDLLTYAGLISGGTILAGGAGIWFALRTLRVRMVRPSWKGISSSLREGWVLFLSSAAVTLYTSGNAFILGLMADDSVVGYYTAAEKIVKVLVNLIGPLSQAVFPRFSKMAEESTAQALRWGKRLLVGMGSIGLVLSVIAFAAAGEIVSLLLGARYAPSVGVLRLLAFLPFLIAISNVLGVQLMIPFGREKAVFVLVLVAGCLNVAMATVLAPTWKAEGMAASVLFAEVFVTAGYFAYLWRARLHPLRKIEAAGTTETSAW